MISILIPVYNFDICTLVQELHRQSSQLAIPFEIICLDDGSTTAFKEKNRTIKEYTHLTYQELPQNLGRSKIRNRLGELAKYDQLLFMDCDSKVVREDYMAHYANHLQSRSVLYGGRVYQPSPPADPALRFHWEYGRQREQQTADQRAKKPFHAFMTNNFIIPKAIFQQIRFDEQLTQYGHEDTLFGMELKRRNIHILHLDNPLEHLGLETQTIFLQKTQKGIENLYQLYTRQLDIETKLLSLFLRLKRNNLHTATHFILRKLKPLIRSAMRYQPKQMRWFDLWKLAILLEYDAQNKDR